MNHFIEYYLILVLVPILFIETIPQNFYKLKSVYPLFLSLQIAIMSSLIYLSFKSEFPLTSITPVYDLFEIKLILDTGNTLFLISFSVSVFLILLRLSQDERKKMTFFITTVFLIALSGNTITFFLSSFLYFIIGQFDIKDKFYGHLIDSFPLVSLLCALSLVMLTGQIHGTQDILNAMGFLSNSGIILFFIMSAFLLPVLLCISDVLFHPSHQYSETKLLITSSSFIYILYRFTESLNRADEIVYYSFIFYISLIVLSIVIFIIYQRKKQSSLIPVIFFYFIILSLSFIHVGLSGQYPINQNYICGFPLYLTLFLMADDILSAVKDKPARFALIASLFIFVFFNPWMNSGNVFINVFSFVLNRGILIVILFGLITLLTILMSALSVLNTTDDDSPDTRYTEKYILFTGLIIFLLLFERFL